MNTSPLVLSLFPGAGLLDAAFEAEGFTIVRGPDLLWGGDIHTFHVPAGVFAGVIGGPPCQTFSTAGHLNAAGKSSKLDLIPEFIRVVNEAQPSFVVMENVRGAMDHTLIPDDWNVAVLRDWDCGGLTSRTRAFWTWPMPMLAPPRRPGQPSHSVMASTYKRGRSDNPFVVAKSYLPGDLPIEEYARLQGADEIGRRLIEHKASKAFAVHCLGNGVPLAMGRYVARAVMAAMDRRVAA